MRLAGCLAGWAAGWLAGSGGWRLPTSRFTCDQGGLPTKCFLEPERKPPWTVWSADCVYVCRVPDRNPLQTQGLPTSRIMDVCTTLEAPRKQNYDQGGSPQAELRPGKLPTSRITTGNLPTSKITIRELAGWLAGWLAALQPGNLFLHLAGWLAGRLAGWLPG